MSDKMSRSHRQRTAYVYVRQSTGHQVRYHHESQRRQYALADHARGKRADEVENEQRESRADSVARRAGSLARP